LGGTGAKLTVQLIYEMKRRKVKYGIVSMCIGGGMGAAGLACADDDRVASRRQFDR
jgi:acetyl-CoA acyltransferase